VHLAFYLGVLARTPRNFQIKEILEVQPELSVRPEVSCQAQRGLRRDSPPLVHYFTDAHFALETHVEEIAFAMRQFLPATAR